MNNEQWTKIVDQLIMSDEQWMMKNEKGSMFNEI